MPARKIRITPQKILVTLADGIEPRPNAPVQRLIRFAGVLGGKGFLAFLERLRRLHDPAEMLTRTASTIAVATLVAALDKSVGALPGALGSKFNIPGTLTGNMWSTWWSSTYIKNGPFTALGHKTVGAWLKTNPPTRSTVIH